MSKVSIIALLLFLSFELSGQTNIDSLWSVWNNADEEAIQRVNALDQIIYKNYLFTKPDSAYVLAGLMYDFAKTNKLPKNVAAAIQIKGGSFYFRSNYDSALFYFEKSLGLFEIAAEKGGLASTMGNMANIYYDQGNFEKAIEYYMRSLKVHEETGNQRGQAVQLMNVGLTHSDLGDIDLALEYLEKSLKINQEINYVEGIADCLQNIGSNYKKRGNTVKATEYYKKALTIHETINDGQGKGLLLVKLGSLSKANGDLDGALEYYLKSLEIHRSMGDMNYVSTSLVQIGNIYSLQKDYQSALSYFDSAMQIAKETGAVKSIKSAARQLYSNYKRQGNYELSLKYYEEYISLRDSMNREENKRALLDQEYKYHYEKKAYSDSIDFAKKEAFTALEIEKQNADLAKQRIGLVAAGGGLILLLLLASSIRRGKKRSDRLLHNILPEEVAAELKSKGTSDAKLFEEATVLFSDFSGFTTIAEEHSPKDLVYELNKCFSHFDGIMEKYQIEKIKTIGDAYMAAGGLPMASEDSVKNTVLAALEMQDFVINRRDKRTDQNQISFEMRVGIHTGPVVAGIVGVKKFQYDVWGDTVNTASRMESNSEVGKVNISQSTYELIKDDAEFSFQSRGKVNVKGKGEIEMLFVSKKK